MKSPDVRQLREAMVLVVGDVMLDRYIWGSVGRISPEAPVQIVLVGKKTAVPGGAANVANNIAGLCAHASLLGVRGKDEAGDALNSLLQAQGISSHLVIDEERPTTTKTRILSQNQQLLRLDEEVNLPLSDRIEDSLIAALDKLMDSAQVVILSDYGKGVLSGKLPKYAIAAARDRHIPVIIDPKGTNWSRYCGATCITPNTPEFEAVASGPCDTDTALIAQAESVCNTVGVERLLVTRGAKGMMLATASGSPIFFGTKAREVFDVSGAGDTVIATLSTSLAAGFGWIEAVHLANTAASVVVAKIGTQPIRLDELEAELNLEAWDNTHRHCTVVDAKNLIQAWRDSGEKIVFTNGCFDLLHAGHIKLIEAAARKGNRLVIGLNSDASVRRLKGEGRPILSQNERATLLSALAEVDLVVIFEDDTPLNLIRELKPDILVKGSDYSLDQVVGRDVVEAYGGQVALVDLEAGVSTTSIVRKIAAQQQTNGRAAT